MSVERNELLLAEVVGDSETAGLLKTFKGLKK
jgi:hypothetical protein